MEGRLLTDEEVKNEFRKYGFDIIADDKMLERVGNAIAITRVAQDLNTAKDVRIEERKAIGTWLWRRCHIPSGGDFRIQEAEILYEDLQALLHGESPEK